MDASLTTRVSLSNLQTQAMVSLLCIIGVMHSIDVAPACGSDAYGTVRITIWQQGDGTTWAIALNGTTKEAS